LGLAISQALTRLHDGEIVTQSEGEGAGVTFTFELPVRDPTVARAVEPLKMESLALNCRILVVEDNVDTREVIELALSALRCTVTTAATMTEAIVAADREPFDLLISDIGLPDSSGLSLMRELRSHRDCLREIALSGFGREQDLAKSKEFGFDAHLVKSVSREMLEETLRELAGRERWTSL
jgi:CheY-like chemotaxis protein